MKLRAGGSTKPGPDQATLFGLEVIPLCSPCRAASDEWLSYQVPAPVIICTIGNRAMDTEMRRQSRFRQWRETIQFQQALIRRLCLEGRHAGRPVEHSERAA